MRIIRFFTLFSILTTIACSTVKKSTYGVADGKVEWIFLHVNDVYEIAPLGGGKIGGLARIATLRKELMQENPNTFTVMAGDFLNPSLIGTLKYEGQGIKGKQMIEVMNNVGFDFVCLGNHEFDLDFPDLQKRIDESNFTWISSNAFHQVGEGIEPFNRSKDPENTGFPEYKIIDISDGASGEKAKIGLWSVVLDANKKDYIHYSDVQERSNSLIEDVLKKEADVIIGLTHVTIDQDKEIAAKNPSVSLIMGGHEHNNMTFDIGKTRITKADANALTAWVHRCSYDIKTKKVAINSKLVPIDSKITEDPETAEIVKKWTNIADIGFKKAGFMPDEVVTTLPQILDGRSATIRFQQNNLGAAITKAMVATAKNQPVDCAFFNSGSVRIDDLVQGTITQSDIIRILPFGGKIYELEIIGSELRKVLTVGLLNKGRGGYLQWYNIAYSDASKSFSINNAPLDDNKSYHILINDFLLSGNENNLEFFTETNPNISNLQTLNPNDATDLRNDIRKALIAYLKKMK
jgi:2',3'-cyclic-nucleotide 2'-phosphodiesterase (5'-nucleotidase family)